MSDTITLPRMIYHSFVVSHPNWIFLYGDTYFNNGFLGQPYHMQLEPNTFAIPVMYKLCPSASDKYFCDRQFELHSSFILEALAKVPKDGRPILPLRKMGDGHSQLKHKAPKLFEFLQSELAKIAYPNIVWDYTAN